MSSWRNNLDSWEPKIDKDLVAFLKETPDEDLKLLDEDEVLSICDTNDKKMLNNSRIFYRKYMRVISFDFDERIGIF